MVVCASHSDSTGFNLACDEEASHAGRCGDATIGFASVRHVNRPSSHHAESGATHSGVENASTDARPGGSRVNATAVSAEYAAICRTPETVTSRQSDGDGRLRSPRAATKPNAQTVATT